MSLVKGENAIGYIYDAGQWETIYLRQDISMSIDTEVVKQPWRVLVTTKHLSLRFTLRKVSLSGVVCWMNRCPLADLHAAAYELKLSSPPYKWLRRMEHVPEEFYAYIVNSTDTGSFDGVATFQMELQVSGSITQVSPRRHRQQERAQIPAARIICACRSRHIYSKHPVHQQTTKRFWAYGRTASGTTAL